MVEPMSLAAVLDEYRETIARHLTAAREQFDAVDRAWRGLAECYAGRGADEFRPSWEETTRRFEEYLDRSALLATVLAEKSQHLRAFDRSQATP